MSIKLYWQPQRQNNEPIISITVLSHLDVRPSDSSLSCAYLPLRYNNSTRNNWQQKNYSDLYKINHPNSIYWKNVKLLSVFQWTLRVYAKSSHELGFHGCFFHLVFNLLRCIQKSPCKIVIGNKWGEKRVYSVLLPTLL